MGEIVWRARDAYGLLVYEGRAGELHPLKVYPRGENVQRLLRPLETQAFSGNQVARNRGEGIEFADLRPVHARRPRSARQLARDRETG